MAAEILAHSPQQLLSGAQVNQPQHEYFYIVLDLGQVILAHGLKALHHDLVVVLARAVAVQKLGEDHHKLTIFYFGFVGSCHEHALSAVVGQANTQALLKYLHPKTHLRLLPILNQQVYLP